jgi:hypothetical protein
MTDAEWGAERLALLAEWEELEAEHARFAVPPPTPRTTAPATDCSAPVSMLTPRVFAPTETHCACSQTRNGYAE